ncbi:hypothetical protein C8Q76DRAFT_694793 [Earliella scabrosa]|nr:hypothetical protein C8Q76DRAFT_694793 [Earliella scabrosa]
MPVAHSNGARWVIRFDPVDHRGRVVEESSAMRAVASREEVARALEAAAAEARRFLQLRNIGSLRVPKDVEDVLTICKDYHLTLLKLRYENARLTEYILHLHTTLLAQCCPATLPQVPAEIAHYVDIRREGLERM